MMLLALWFVSSKTVAKLRYWIFGGARKHREWREGLRWRDGGNEIYGHEQPILKQPYIVKTATYSSEDKNADAVYDYIKGSGPMAWIYGPTPATHRGIVHGHKFVNTLNSFLGRILNDVIANPKYKGDFDAKLVVDYKAWCRLYWTEVLDDVPIVQPMIYDRWLKHYTPSKRQELEEARKEGHWRWTRERMFKMNWRGIFLKLEYLLIHPSKWDTKQARIIMGPHPEIKVLSGPFCYTVSKQLMKKFSCDINDTSSYNRLFYASGYDRKQLGEVYEWMVEQVCLSGEAVQVNMDHDRFDLHHKKDHFDVQWECANTLCYANKDILLWQEDSYNMRGSFNHYPHLAFEDITIRGSGGSFTTGGNSINNGLSAMWAWFMALSEAGYLPDWRRSREAYLLALQKFALFLIFMIVLGDDNLTIMLKEYVKLIPLMEKYLSKLGWSVKVEFGILDMNEFCSSCYVECESQINWEPWRACTLLLNQPGRVIAKFGISLKQRGGPQNQQAYLVAILHGYSELDAIPFMKAWRERIMFVCSTSEAAISNPHSWAAALKREKKKVAQEKRLHYRVQRGGDYRTRPNAGTWRWIRARYGISVSDVESLINYFHTITRKTIISHPVLTKILNVDVYVE